MKIVIGSCVEIPDGRIGRIREKINNQYKVRVKRTTSDSHVFMYFKTKDLNAIECPKGWMSIEGYNSYIRKTLKKMKERSKR